MPTTAAVLGFGILAMGGTVPADQIERCLEDTVGLIRGCAP
ncbi:hypothetical protein [Streptomyces sp. T028]